MSANQSKCVLFCALFALSCVSNSFAQTQDKTDGRVIRVYTLAYTNDESTGRAVFPGAGVELQIKLSQNLLLGLPFDFASYRRTLRLQSGEVEHGLKTYRAGLSVMLQKPAFSRMNFEVAVDGHVLIIHFEGFVLGNSMTGSVRLADRSELQFSPAIRLGGALSLKKTLAMHLHFGRSFWRLANENDKGSHWSPGSRVQFGLTYLF